MLTIEERLANVERAFAGEALRFDRLARTHNALAEKTEDLGRWLRRLETRAEVIEHRISALEASSGAAGGTTATESPTSLAADLTSRLYPETGSGSASAESGPSIERGRHHATNQGSA